MNIVNDENYPVSEASKEDNTKWTFKKKIKSE